MVWWISRFSGGTISICLEGQRDVGWGIGVYGWKRVQSLVHDICRVERGIILGVGNWKTYCCPLIVHGESV